MKKRFIFTIAVCCLIYSCMNKGNNITETKVEGRVPVTVTHPASSSLLDAVELNATSVFLLKTYVKSNINGYLQEVNAQLGEKITKGKKLFLVRSKEAANLGTSISLPDTSFRFSGLVTITSPGSGFITRLNYQPGDYVQDGETLAEISDGSSLVFLLELPYELKPFLPLNRTIDLILPDGHKLEGILFRPMPMVDPVSQTQGYVIKVSQKEAIPENLVAKVNFIRNRKFTAVSLPKEAVLTNETQSEFWIVKMVDSITAVKVVVKKGIESNGRIEIISPEINPADNIILTGNYGLPDTAKVTILKKEE